jgi:hypothetical protein
VLILPKVENDRVAPKTLDGDEARKFVPVCTYFYFVGADLPCTPDRLKLCIVARLAGEDVAGDAAWVQVRSGAPFGSGQPDQAPEAVRRPVIPNRAHAVSMTVD